MRQAETAFGRSHRDAVPDEGRQRLEGIDMLHPLTPWQFLQDFSLRELRLMRRRYALMCGHLSWGQRMMDNALLLAAMAYVLSRELRDAVRWTLYGSVMMGVVNKREMLRSIAKWVLFCAVMAGIIVEVSREFP